MLLLSLRYARTAGRLLFLSSAEASFFTVRDSCLLCCGKLDRRAERIQTNRIADTALSSYRSHGVLLW